MKVKGASTDRARVLVSGPGIGSTKRPGGTQMTPKFYPVSLNKAANEVVEQITFVIRSGAVSPGERLPQIDELSEMMQVSKPVIGEALRILSDAGIVETKRGLGGGVVVVRDEIPMRLISQSPFWQRFSLAELLAARRPIETQIALLATERATKEDFDDMRLQIDLLQKYRRANPAKRIHHDHLFHYSMGRAARSALLSHYQHEIMEQLYARAKEYFDQYENVDVVIALHQETLEALESRNPKQTMKAIDRHLRSLEEAIAGQES
jgi:GntR family transcriptional regulator, transcriptional repressor for pyruvate dehydrogenase complex